MLTTQCMIADKPEEKGAAAVCPGCLPEAAVTPEWDVRLLHDVTRYEMSPLPIPAGGFFYLESVPSLW